MGQLAALLFADMTGCTAVMNENEQLARVRRKRLKEVPEISIGIRFLTALPLYGYLYEESFIATD
jgi:adenylate cyclase